jgi:hypothetical protein
MPKAEQLNIFKDNHGTINVNSRPRPPKKVPESMTAPLSLKMETSDRDRLRDFCFEHDMTLSQCLRQGGLRFIEQYEYIPKLDKYWDAVVSLLNKLP